jgi:hypothetical protein
LVVDLYTAMGALEGADPEAHSWINESTTGSNDCTSTASGLRSVGERRLFA